MDLVVELGRHQSDVQVRLALQNGQVEQLAPDSQTPTHHSDMLLLDRSATTACLVLRFSILVTNLLCSIGCALARDTSGRSFL